MENSLQADRLAVEGVLYLLYGSVSLVTIIGNTLVILVIFKNQRMRTTTNLFIANLSVADVVLGLFSTPFQFQAAVKQSWDLPHFVCTLSAFAKELSVMVGVSTLVVVAVERYRAVLLPLKPGWSIQRALVILSFLWSVCTLSALPTALAYRVIEVHGGHGQTKYFCYPCYSKIFGTGQTEEHRPIPINESCHATSFESCPLDQSNGTSDSTASFDDLILPRQESPDFDHQTNVEVAKLYGLYLACIQYLVPLTVISLAYFKIIRHLWRTKVPGSVVHSRDQIISRNKQKVVKMLIIVVVVFAVCWLPLQLYNILSVVHPAINRYRHIEILWLCSNWLGMSNSCYNPFIYGLFNEKFKQSFKLMFACRGRLCFSEGRRNCDSLCSSNVPNSDITIRTRCHAAGLRSLTLIPLKNHRQRSDTERAQQEQKEIDDQS